MENQYLIIDFDSTIIQTEGLDELAAIVLKNNPQKSKILDQIRQITTLGMEGKLNFDESLSKRFNLLHIEKKDLEILSKVLKRKISPSILRNKHFFKKYRDKIYVITGGFKEYVIPVLKDLELKADHILGSFDEFLFINKLPMTISFPKSKIKALLLENIEPSAKDPGYN